MASTRLFLDLRGKAQDGKGSVLISIYHNSTTTTVKTGVRVLPENWSNQKVINLKGSEAINAKLYEQKSELDKSIALLSMEDDFQSMSASDIKKSVSSVKRIKCPTLQELFLEYMDTGNLKDGTKDIYYSALRKVIAFSGERTRIEVVNLKWLRSFDQFMAKTQGANGRSMYMRSLRAVCNYARNNGLMEGYPFASFQIKHEETAKRCIPVDLLRRFHDCRTTELNAVYRDYFFLMFYLIGINTKDILLAKKSQIVNGRLEYTREKTGKKYSVKIEPEAYALINKHSGTGDYLLDAMDHCKHYESFVHEINDGLKKIGSAENGTSIQGITTYYARHTWATLAHSLDISSDVIAMALGHSQINRTTFIYIQPDQKKVDDANRRVIDHFLGKA